LEKRQSADNKKPLDENCATHLIRNALGGVSGDVELQYARLEVYLNFYFIFNSPKKRKC